MQLSQDPNFHYELIRSLGIVRYAGGDIGEQLALVPKIKPGDIESWYEEWDALAKRVLSTIDESPSLGPLSAVSLRDIYFRASHYFFVADFFIHGNPTDPRLRQSYDLWRKYFDKANELLPSPGKHGLVPTKHGFQVPIIVYQPPQYVNTPLENKPRPTLLIGGGFDSNYEETLHVFGFPALERGYNVVLYEGPGQPTLLHKQNTGFIAEWENVVTPVIDYIAQEQERGNLAFIDFQRIGLIGMSLGGYLSARAAAFEPRLAALMCVDGVLSFPECMAQINPEAIEAFERGDEEACNAAFEKDFASTTGKRWFHDHSKFSFRCETGWEVLQIASKMTLAGGIAQKIKIPTFVGEAQGDLFFGDQPLRVAQSIGSNASLVSFGDEHAASAHCQSGALVYLNQKLLDWFGNVVS